MVFMIRGFCFTLHIPHHSASNVGSQRGVPIPTSFHTTAISQSGDIATAKLVIFIKRDIVEILRLQVFFNLQSQYLRNISFDENNKFCSRNISRLRNSCSVEMR